MNEDWLGTESLTVPFSGGVRTLSLWDGRGPKVSPMHMDATDADNTAFGIVLPPTAGGANKPPAKKP